MRGCKTGKMNDLKMGWVVLLSVVFIAACGDGGSHRPGGGAGAPDATLPTVSATTPEDAAAGVAINRKIMAIFSEAMDAATLTAATFTLLEGTMPVSGAVTYGGATAVFTPASNLASNTSFTATLTTGIKDPTGNALAANKIWSFTTGSTVAAGPDPVSLGTAGSDVLLAKAGVSTTGATAVVGDIGLSPAAGSSITGFSETLDAAGRVLPDFTELGAGNIDGMTLVPGLYKWGTGVTFPIGVTLAGGANDVWIFQIAQDLDVGNGAIVTLSGGAQSENVFWQVAGQATLGTTSDFKGVILSQTLIALNTGAAMNGRALAQTAITLDATAITAP